MHVTDQHAFHEKLFLESLRLGYSRYLDDFTSLHISVAIIVQG